MPRRPPQGPPKSVRFQVHHSRVGAPPMQAWWVFDPEADAAQVFTGTALQCATYSHARREHHDHDAAVQRAHAVESFVRCSHQGGQTLTDPVPPPPCPVMVPAGGPAYCEEHAAPQRQEEVA